MACVVCDCVFSHGFGQVEDAPVCYAADYAAGVQDDVAGCFCDSVGVRSEEKGGRQREEETDSRTSARLPGRTCGGC
jgi:hypothetical protein